LDAFSAGVFRTPGPHREDALTEVAHSANNFFESAVVGNGLLHRDRLGFAFTSQALCIGVVGASGSLGKSNPVQRALFRTVRSAL
jgi:hypothetical protein